MNLIIICIISIPFYFFRFKVLGVPVNIFEISIFIGLIVGLWQIWKNHKKPLWGNILPYILLAVGAFSIIFAQDKQSALGIFKGWFLVPIIFYWLIINFWEVKNQKLLFYPLSFNLIMISLWAIGQKLQIIGPVFYQAGDPSFNQYLGDNFRVFGPFESPNFLAMYIVPVMLVSLGLIGAKLKEQKIYWLLVIIPLIALILTESRGGLIALFAGIITIIYLLNKDKFRQKQIFSLSVVGLLIAIGAIIIALNYKSESNLLRLEIYKYSWELIKAHPVFGVGLGGYFSALKELNLGQSFIENGLVYALHPHNLIFALWLNLGLVGLIIFGTICFISIKDLFVKNNKFGFFLISALIAILVHGLFDTTYFKNDLSAIFWLIIALTVITTKYEPT